MKKLQVVDYKLQVTSLASGFKLQVNSFWLLACSLQLVAFSSVTCVAQKPTKSYYEDLSTYRPTFESKIDTVNKIIVTTKVERVKVKPTKNVNTKVDAVLDSIDKQNLLKKFVDGFTIQIYSGQSKEEAMATKQKVVEELKDLTANLQYLQPKFRVNVGNYFSKLEAQKDLVKLKSLFPGAILVPEKISIRYHLTK